MYGGCVLLDHSLLIRVIWSVLRQVTLHHFSSNRVIWLGGEGDGVVTDLGRFLALKQQTRSFILTCYQWKQIYLETLGLETPPMPEMTGISIPTGSWLILAWE